MSDKKTIFVAFAIEDRASRDLLRGQSLLTTSPFEYIDMGVKEPYETEWKKKVRTRILRSDGVIALVSKDTAKATGQLWEITCAVEEGVPLMGIWIGGHRTKPSQMGSAPCKDWTWASIRSFIDSV